MIYNPCVRWDNLCSLNTPKGFVVTRSRSIISSSTSIVVSMRSATVRICSQNVNWDHRRSSHGISRGFLRRNCNACFHNCPSPPSFLCPLPRHYKHITFNPTRPRFFKWIMIFDDILGRLTASLCHEFVHMAKRECLSQRCPIISMGWVILYFWHQGPSVGAQKDLEGVWRRCIDYFSLLKVESVLATHKRGRVAVCGLDKDAPHGEFQKTMGDASAWQDRMGWSAWIA